MNEIHVPFDFSPFTTTIKTSGYTIPAGYRARVTPLFYDFLIDTVTPMKAATKPFHTIGASGSFYLVGEPGEYFAQMVQGGGSGLAYEFYWVSGGLSHLISTSSGVDMSALAGLALGALPTTSQGAGAVYVKVNHSVTPSTLSVDLYHKKLDPLWVPTGTVLNGGRYLVELYANQG
jgi:hypothetical protein